MTITNELSPGQGLNIDERWFKLYIKDRNTIICLKTLSLVWPQTVYSTDAFIFNLFVSCII